MMVWGFAFTSKGAIDGGHGSYSGWSIIFGRDRYIGDGDQKYIAMVSLCGSTAFEKITWRSAVADRFGCFGLRWTR